MVDFAEKIDIFMVDNLTRTGYNFMYELSIPNLSLKPTSSSGRYHSRPDGSIPSQAEHVYTMLINGKRMLRALDYKENSKDADAFYLAIYLHDMYKFGYFGMNDRTEYEHDRMAADAIEKSRKVFESHFTQSQTDRIIEAVRYHSGRWSTDVTEYEDLLTLHPMTHMVHFLDMGDTNNVLRTED
jgi:hypothetical protein